MRLLLVALVLVACGDDSAVPPGFADAPPAALSDAPPGVPTADAVPPDGPPVGQLCGLPAFDGGPGTCPSGLECCSVAGSAFQCVEPSDCSMGPGFVVCTTAGDCPGGRVCCEVTGQRFCTKRSSCDLFGGMAF